MNILLLLIIIFILFDIESKLNKFVVEIDHSKRHIDLLKQIEHNFKKDVYITVNDYKITEKGQIIAYDEEWFVFAYCLKGVSYEQYFRVKDLTRIELN